MKSYFKQIQPNSRYTAVRRCSTRKGVPKNFLRLATLLKKRLRHCCFHENFVKCLRTSFFDRIPPVAASENILVKTKLLVLL